MKKALIFFILIILLSSSIQSMALADETNVIRIIVDGEKMVFDKPPIIIEGRVLVTLESIEEIFERKIEFCHETFTLTAIKDGTVIVMPIKSNNVLVNDYAVNLDVSARFIENHIMIPLRFIFEQLGSNIEWEQATRTVIVTSNRNDSIKLEDVSILNYSGRRIKWLDEQGNLYAVLNDLIQKSKDGGESWVTIHTHNIQEDGLIAHTALLVTGTGRIIYSTGNGNVYVSSETQKDFREAFQFAAGYVHHQFPYAECENIVLLGAYGKWDSSGENPPREVYMSEDYGETWTKILEMDWEDPTKAHIHDVEYDPYYDRVIVALGDQVNGNVIYSDDRGKCEKRL